MVAGCRMSRHRTIRANRRLSAVLPHLLSAVATGSPACSTPGKSLDSCDYHPGPFRRWDGQEQPRGQPRKPPLLVGDDLRAQGAARQPRDEPVPDPVQLVAPAVREERYRQPGKVGVLAGEQPPHQVRRHRHIGARLRFTGTTIDAATQCRTKVD